MWKKVVNPNNLGPVVILLIVLFCLVKVLPFEFKLWIIDWTAISSILTLGAIGVSIYSNHTANRNLKAVIAIQHQNAGLSMMDKRIEIIQAIKADQPSGIKSSDVLYYFDSSCAQLFEDYFQKYRQELISRSRVENYFNFLRHQYIFYSDGSDTNQILNDIKEFERLALEYDSSDNEAEKEYERLSKKYLCHESAFDSDGNTINIPVSYDEACDRFHMSEKEKHDAQNLLIQSLENLFFDSVKLKF